MVGKGRDRGRQENLTSVSLFQKKKGGGVEKKSTKLLRKAAGEKLEFIFDSFYLYY